VDIRGEECLSKGSVFFTLQALKDTERNLGSCEHWMTSELTDVRNCCFPKGGVVSFLLCKKEGSVCKNLQWSRDKDSHSK